MASTATDAHADSEPAADFHVVSHDAVPRPDPPSLAARTRADDMALLRQWLQPTDYLSPGNEYMKHLHAHVPGTGSWMHQSDSFTAWIRDDTATPCLHLKGVAGSGKSVLATSTIRHLQHSEPGVPVLFFFFRQIVEKNHSARYLIRDFAAQLLPYSHSLSSAVNTLSQSQGVNGTEKNKLWALVSQALRDLPRAFCVVDALDEMDEEDFSFINQLIDLVEQQETGIRLLFTSRPIPKIEDVLRSPRILRGKLDASMLYPDVAKYVTVSMGTLEPSLSPETEDRVRDTICERAQGLFLHARLMIEHLTESLRDGRITENQLPQKLERLPRNLVEVYEQMLIEHARRSGVSTEQQAGILSCVIHASRPLRLIELGALIARMRGDDDLKEGKRLIRASCGRLLEILEDESVSVIHHSFTEFLCNADRQQTPGSFPVLDPVTGHMTLVSLCLRYLNGCPRLDIDKDEPGDDEYDDYDDAGEHLREMDRREKVLQKLQMDHPLLSYAAGNLRYHLDNTDPNDAQVFEALDKWLHPGQPAFSIIVFQWWRFRLCSSFNTLHLAIEKELKAYALHLIVKQPAWIDVHGGDGMTPLCYAASNGHADVAMALLRAGVDASARNRLGLSPLHLAAGARHVEVTKLLLEHGVDPMIKKTKNTPYLVHHFYQYDKGETALKHAMKSGSAETLALFLSVVTPEDANRCLHWAQNAESLDVILRTGYAAVDSFCGGSTLLFRAASKHDVESMRVLLKHGADPNKRCSGESFYSTDSEITLDVENHRGPTPLHAFAGYDKDKDIYDEKDQEKARQCFQLLVDHGVDLSATTDGEPRSSGSSKDLTALHYSVQKRYDYSLGWHRTTITGVTIAEILLRAGVDPNARSSDGGTPLFFANADVPGIIDVLVKYGADVNARADSGRTPLLRLIMSGVVDGLNTETFQKLIDHGADVNAVDSSGDGIFHQLFRVIDKFKEADIPFLNTLIDAKADMNLKNGRGLPPLLALKTQGPDKALLEHLIRKGLDLDARSTGGETILWKLAGSYNADIDMFDMFLRLGADPKAVNEKGETLLHLAVKRDLSSDWVKFLITCGVDPTTSAKDGQTVIHCLLTNATINEATFNTLDLLSEHVSAAENTLNGRTPLHIASLRDRGTERSWAQMEDWISIVQMNPVFGQPDINARDTRGLTALHLASSVSEYNVGKLLKAGADLGAVTVDGITPLHVACRTREPAVVAVLLAALEREGVLDKHLTMTDNGPHWRRTALHFACQSGCADSVRLLLRHGADPRCLDGRGRTPLHALAEYSWNTSSGRNKKKKKKKKKTSSTSQDPVEVDETCRVNSPSYGRLAEGAAEIIRALCEAGADFDARTSAEEEEEGLMTAQDIARETGYSTFLLEASQYRRAQHGDVACQDAEVQAEVQEMLGIQVASEVPCSIHKKLQTGRQQVVKEFARAGGDLYALTQFGDDTGFSLMVDEGQTSLLKYFKHELARVDEVARSRKQDQNAAQARNQHINSQGNEEEEEEECDGDEDQDIEEDVDDHDDGGPATLLDTACRRSVPNLDVVKILVEEVGLDVNGYSHVRGFGYKLKRVTPLHILASGQYFWQIEALEYLLGKGADMRATNSGGLSPLLVAISPSHPCGFWREETVRCLLKHGADPNSVDPKTGLAAIAMSTHTGVTRALLEHGADIIQAPEALAAAVGNQDEALVEVLLSAGANTNARGVAVNNSTSCTKVHTTSAVRDEPALDEKHYLIHEAATLPFSDSKCMVREGWAARRERIVRELLSHGAAVSADYSDGSPMLQRIVEEQGLLSPMLEDHVGVNLERRGIGGRTLLLSACIPSVPQHPPCYGSDAPPPETVNSHAASALLDIGADVNAVDNLGRMPLHWLCSMNSPFDLAHQEILERLISKDPSAIEIADNKGNNPLHLCLIYCQDWASKRLLELGASCPVPNSEGNTALHILASRLLGEKTRAATARGLFEQFLQLGADINARNGRGETALFVFLATPWKETCYPARKGEDYAPENDVFHCHVLPLFVDAGADLSTADDKGLTLLHAVAGQELATERYRDRLQSEDVGNTFARLLELGSDPRREDDKLRTALDLAVTRKWRGIVDLFSDEGKERLRRKKERSGPDEKHLNVTASSGPSAF